jgi:hypothetical protein
MKLLIKTTGFIGDILFATSIAKKAKLEHGIEEVDYLINLRQPKLLMMVNPYIHIVHVNKLHPFDRTYDFEVTMPLVDQSEPATIQFQRMAGIAEPEVDYEVYTVQSYDDEAQQWIWDRMSLSERRPVVGYVVNWIDKSFEFTPEEYARGVDVPHLGYGGRKHDIPRVIKELSKHFFMVPIGLPSGVGQFDPKANDASSYAYTASLVKACDFVIGPEGGLTNLAAGVGTTCIMATDFVWQLYGPNGLFKRLESPAMGPKTYFPDADHVHLDPFLDTDGIISAIIENVARLYKP